MHTNLIQQLGLILNKYMNPLFNVRGEGAFAFIMGILSGYPIGAKIITNFRKNNICSKEECERLLSFTNNSGPLFIIGTIGILMYSSTTIGLLLFITHILACITVGIIFRFWKYNITKKSINNVTRFTNSKNIVTFSNLGTVLSDSIKSSISTILMVGGFVVIFSALISILKSSGILNFLSICILPILKIFHIDFKFATSLIEGFFEITSGINSISTIYNKQISINIFLTAFLLGTGGFSVFLQVYSIISKTDLSIMPYIYGKLLQGIIAVSYTYLLICFIPMFNLNL